MRLKPVLFAASALLFACSNEGLPENPQLQPDRTEIRFGGEFSEGVWVGTVKRETLQLKNIGTATLAIGDVSVSGADASLFTTQIDTVSVGSLQKAFVAIDYAPTAAGTHQATLTVTSNAENSPVLEIALSATAVAPAD